MRISEPARARAVGGHASRPIAAARGAAGFTLLELLVVVALVGILTGTVLLSITGADAEQRLRGTAEQLAYRIELARQYALQHNREWGVYVEEGRVRFAEYDPERSSWVEQSRRPFDGAEIMEHVKVHAEADDVGELPARDRERLPDVLLFSSGEVTPFRVMFEPEWGGPTWVVSSDGLSQARAAPAES